MSHLKQKTRLFLFILLSFVAGCTAPENKGVPPSELPKNAIILDIRTKQEYEEVSLIRAHHHVEMQSLIPKAFLKENQIKKSDSLYILCRSGRRAQSVTTAFKKAGLKNVFVIQGGLLAFENHDVKRKEE